MPRPKREDTKPAASGEATKRAPSSRRIQEECDPPERSSSIPRAASRAGSSRASASVREAPRTASRAASDRASASVRESKTTILFSDQMGEMAAKREHHTIDPIVVSKAASSRTSASVREARNAILLKGLEEDEAIEMERLELELKLKQVEIKKRFKEERFLAASQLLDAEEGSSRCTSLASLHSGRVKSWVAESTSAAIVPQQNIVRELAAPLQRQAEPNSRAVSEEIRRMRANLLSSGEQFSGPPEPITRNQLAARNALSKELPTFSGRPEEWPSFYASYITSTEICGFRLEENLVRLQRCLKGAALDAVQGRLILPASVPQVIETLKRRFGRPEWLLQMLIDRVTNAVAPRPDKLESLITFGNLVQGLCDHIVAAELPEHMNNPCLLQTLVTKLPADYRMRWAAFRRGRATVDLKLFADYMEEIVEDASSVVPYSPLDVVAPPRAAPKYAEPIRFKSLTTVAKPVIVCPVCNDEHSLQKCPEFVSKTPEQRRHVVILAKRCNNCLQEGHMWAQCPSRFNCRICKQRHHSMLHYERDRPRLTASEIAGANAQSPVTNVRSRVCNPPEAAPLVSAMTVDASHVLLQTAVVNMVDAFGQTHPVRALLDSASQPDLITDRLARRLQLRVSPANVIVEGAGKHLSAVRGAVFTEVRSRHKDFSLGVQFLVVDQLVSNLPAKDIELPSCELPDDVPLADPWFNESHPVDIVIGARHYHEVFSDSHHMQPARNFPVLLDSVFGWVATGPVAFEQPDPFAVDNAYQPICMLSLETSIERFWNAESMEEKKMYTSDERFCEELYKTTTQRDKSGRYIVQLPRRPEFDAMMGKSKTAALRRFELLERRLDRNSELRDEYHRFMKEYLEMGHMRPISGRVDDTAPIYYLPHHPVFKQDSTTTKVRVVFDASAKTSTGYSLNEALCVGPVVQDELLDIVMRFRTFPVALIGDIAKMYRQVLLHEKDRTLARIFFRFSKETPVQAYELCTVTYGLAPSSFLATRTLVQLVEDEGRAYPLAGPAVRENFYVDDYIGGASTVEEAVKLRLELAELLEKGGFMLRKWASNRQEVLEGLQDSEIATQTSFKVGQKNTIKALGICWEPEADMLCFKPSIENDATSPTKRSILASIAKLFDPLGLVAPVIVKAKLLMQQLWLLDSDWDEPVPEQVAKAWKTFQGEWHLMGSFKVPRYALHPTSELQLHVFTDASESAYGACIYARCAKNAANASITLLASKSRVAPLKRVSLPRLELCAALLGAQLHTRVSGAMRIPSERSVFWCDSMVALQWINAPSHAWKTYVANRVAEIQELTAGGAWRHVPGNDNPADLVSRGMSVVDFLQCRMWKHGPTWLAKPDECWPINHLQASKDAEIETKLIALPVTIRDTVHPWFDQHSSYIKLLRLTAYCLRFIRNLKRKNRQTALANSGSLALLNPVLLEAANEALLRLAQSEAFRAEIALLENNKEIPKASALRRLTPFLDERGVLRVGGRLKLAALPYQFKHPALLPKAHPFARLIAEDFHERLVHGGGRLLLSCIREKYWPLDGRTLVKRVVRNCFRCARYQPAPMHQQIGQIPASRITPARPFLTTGVDYAGPFYLKPAHRRAASLKCYLCVFVCFTTKAVHLELVSDLTTSGFLAALRRFVSRRGIPAHIHSDNGKNFVGAKNELAELFAMVDSPEEQRRITSACAGQGITWHLIPPKAPNFGGLWEAAVKTAKKHLFRQLGSTRLSFEGYTTILHQIEAAMNSRPLLPMSDDPNDLAALTPAHFLIGSSVLSVPDPDYDQVKRGSLDQYQQWQLLVQKFWKHWRSEYLQELQRDTKIAARSNALQPGQLVILIDDLLPVTRWPLARIVRLHEGKDGITRVVQLKTSRGELTRPVSKICLLPPA